MDNNYHCGKECPKWIENQKRILSECESIFEAVDAINTFENECRETCTYINTNN